MFQVYRYNELQNFPRILKPLFATVVSSFVCVSCGCSVHWVQLIKDRDEITIILKKFSFIKDLKKSWVYSEKSAFVLFIPLFTHNSELKTLYRFCFPSGSSRVDCIVWCIVQCFLQPSFEWRMEQICNCNFFTSKLPLYICLFHFLSPP